jgi:hypothetical protein
MEVGSENHLRDRLDPKNFEPNSETKVSQKGKTLYYEKKIYVNSGTRQQNV